MFKKKKVRSLKQKKEWHRIPNFAETNKGIDLFLKRDGCYRPAYVCV